MTNDNFMTNDNTCELCYMSGVSNAKPEHVPQWCACGCGEDIYIRHSNDKWQLAATADHAALQFANEQHARAWELITDTDSK